MTMSIVLLYVPLCLALSVYPFTSRTVITSILAVTFFVIAIIVGRVYAEITRRGWIKMVWKPGENALGTEFWIKIVGFLVGPALGLLATQYPAIVEWLLSWAGSGGAGARRRKCTVRLLRRHCPACTPLRHQLVVLELTQHQDARPA
jgi:hypothetical protein